MSILNQLNSKIKDIVKTETAIVFDLEIDQIITKIYKETKKDNSYYWGRIKLTNSPTYQSIRAKNPKEKIAFLDNLLEYFIIKRKNYNRKIASTNEMYRLKLAVANNLIGLLLRQKLLFEEAELIQLIDKILTPNKSNFYNPLPIGAAFKQFEKYIKENGLSDTLTHFLETLEKHPELKSSADFEKIRAKINKLTNHNPSFMLSEEDGFGQQVNEDIKALPAEAHQHWYALFNSAAIVKGGKPTKKYLAEVKPFVDALGKDFKPHIWKWLELVLSLKVQEINQTHRWGTYGTMALVEGKNANLLKGLVWALTPFHDKRTLELLGRLAEKSFKKIPGIGPASAALGNACIYVLAQSKGLVGISHLSRLKLKIQQNNTRKLIGNYIAAQSKKRGIAPAEIEDLAVPKYGLVAGKKEIAFKDYLFKIEIIGIGKVQTQWVKPDGKNQKTTPAFIKQNKKLNDKLKTIKTEVKQIQKYLTAQRDRVDRNYINNRTWQYPTFKEHYLTHGLMGFITKGLIWNLHTEQKVIPAIWLDQQWQSLDGTVIEEATIQTVTLWHPVESTTEKVLAWRDKLANLQIKQPFKQAYREVYILTDAELNTSVYSNRMAAHILKQHQFNALAGLRGWKYALMGWYDDGRDDEIAHLSIPAYGLSAEFWIGSLNENDAWTESGIWSYITTDQVRFTNENSTLNLVDIPKIVFSEVMRDVDMFVGVASVGNDPQWQDNGGLRQHHTYWQSYSFGNLSEMAKTRKAVLEKLLPRLKIKEIAHIEGKFLIVKGKLRTYKIHIGSTNILMAPNDQYLCIVPSRKKNTKTDKLFLPFEGDRGLSVVLSKAFLLAADDKITDSTIISQIQRR